MGGDNGHFDIRSAIANMPEYRNGVDALENEATIKQEREEDTPLPLTPLDIFGDSRLIGSPIFPHGIVPSIIENRARDVAERLGVDPAMVAVPMLAVCAACIDDRIQVVPLQYDTTWKESCRLWVAIIAESGQKKTPAINAALRPLRSIEKDWMKADYVTQADYKQESAIYDTAKKQQQREYAKALAKGVDLDLPDLPHPPIRPPMRRKEVKDTTIEALSEVFKDNPWGLLAVYDELTTWFGSFDAYRGDKIKKDRSLYLEAYNGGAQVIDRVSRGLTYVPNWSLGLIGGIQPSALRKISASLADDGLAQRFLPIFCDSDGITIDRAEDAQSAFDYEQLVRELTLLSAGGEEARLFIRFEPDAYEMREFVNKRVHYVRAMPWVTEGFQTHLSKWEGVFPRLCLLWHCIEYAHEGGILPEKISVDTAQQVAGFMLDYLLPHASRFYTELMQTKDEEHHARWIAGHILAHDLEKISARDIGRVFRPLRGQIKDIQQAMEQLVALSWVQPIDAGIQGGHRQWKVNPKVHSQFQDRKEREKKERADTVRKIQEAVGAFPVLGTEQ